MPFGSENIGNVAPLYIIYLLKRYGSERKEASFYASLYFKAFPDLVNDYVQEPYHGANDAHHCYIYRTFDKGLFMFGLVDIEYEGKIMDKKQYITSSALYRQLF